MEALFVAVVVLSAALNGATVLFGPGFPDQAHCVRTVQTMGYVQVKDAGAKIYCVDVQTLTPEQLGNSTLIDPSQLNQADYVERPSPLSK